MSPKFEDISKAPLDILTDDYSSKVTLKCKKPAGPFAVTLETERGSGGALSSKVGAKFSYAGLKFDKVQFKPDGSNVLETSLSPYDGCVLSFKGGKGADLGVDYTKGSFVGTGTLDVKEMSKLSTSACVGLAGGINIGGEATYNISGKAGISSFNVGGNYSKGPLFASATTASKMSQVNVALMYSVNDKLTLASSSTHSSATPIESASIGALYKSSLGNVKGKYGSNGTVSACLSREVAPKVTVTASGSASTSDLKNIKYGLGIVM